MTRTIKFRAWEKDLEAMSLNYFDLDSEDRFLQLDRISSGRDVAWMQFTGLHDKNGKEIYEGDIFNMGVIGFDRGCFNGFYTESRSNDKGWDYSDSWEDGMYHYVSENEIIGNIYEHSQLLNKE